MPDDNSNSYKQKPRKAPMKTLNAKQLESVPFQSSVSAYLTQSSCEESHTRASESDAFKNNLTNERRKNLYSFLEPQGVVPDIASNNYTPKCVMHPWSKHAQWESVSFPSSVSAHLTQDKDYDEELESLGLGKIVQPTIKKTVNKNLNTNQRIVEMKVIHYLKNIGLENVTIKNLTNNNVGEYFLDSTRKLLYLLPSKLISQWLLTKYSNYSVHVINKKEFKCFIVKPKMQSQGLFDALGEMFSGIHNTGQFLMKIIKNLKDRKSVV